MIRKDGTWLTAAEAAARLGVSESTALADAKDDRLRARDLGPGRRPRWLISAEDVERVVRTGGRVDRRVHGRRQSVPSEEASDERIQTLERALEEARRELTDAYGLVARLQAEAARLRLVARNANVAVQAQTDSLQQYLIDEPS